ncbi:MAG TPA: GlsB/YeaQ/YmgE family stress response membrane protein [Caulobacteraceae bacterium]|jgi:uncharacterized membrane protein YeaQ/YmgE (transglycosylase-associated protein family)
MENIIVWLIIGVVAGFVASKLVNKTGGGLVFDLILGIIGAIVGGWLFNMFGSSGVTGLNIWSFIVAIIGAVVVLIIYHAITGRGRRTL